MEVRIEKSDLTEAKRTCTETAQVSKQSAKSSSVVSLLGEVTQGLRCCICHAWGMD